MWRFWVDRKDFVLEFQVEYKFIYFNWRLITVQYCIGFAIHQHESAHGYTRVPHPEPSSLPIPFLWVIPVHQPRGSSIMHQTWTGNLFLIWYYTCFNAILPNHPTLSLSHRVQNTVLCTGVSFSVWLFLKNVLWVTFLSFGNCNNCLVVCWASLSSPLPGRTSEVNN